MADSNDRNQVLRKIFLFSDFTDKEFKLLDDFISIKKFSKGEQIFIEGVIAREFYIISSGKVKIYKLSSNGDEHILHVQIPGDLIAEAAIFDLKIYPAFCSALEDTELISISTDRFYTLIEKNPQIAIKMMSAYSRRLREFVSKIADLSFRNVKSRLAKYIIDNSDEQKICNISFSKKELAALLGTIPETLSRTFDYLKKKGLIEEKNQSIHIIDEEKLTILADL
jgi:CRP/FNR family transcriptional regulator, dissimilatory nitrate respiration regulator